MSLAGGRAGSLALKADVAAPQLSASFLPRTWQSQLAHTLQEERESRRVPSNGRRHPTRQTLRLLLLHRRRRSRTCRRKSTPPRSVSTSCRTIHSAQAAQLPFRSVPNPCPRFPDADRAEENSRIPRCGLFLLHTTTREVGGLYPRDPVPLLPLLEPVAPSPTPSGLRRCRRTEDACVTTTRSGSLAKVCHTVDL